MTRWLEIWLAALLMAVPRSARGEDCADFHRAGLSLRLGVVNAPSGHLGIPLGGSAYHHYVSPELAGRYQLQCHFAVVAGIGLPAGALGFGGWAGLEGSLRLAADARDMVALEVYTSPGLQLSYAGPDYYARHEDVFVGYNYSVSGPMSFGGRLPIGLRTRWFHGIVDTFVEAVPSLVLTPEVDPFFTLVAGVGIRFL